MEDSRADLYLIREAIKASSLNVIVQTVRDGEQATDIFDAIDQDETLPCPGLLILDINLPKKHGGEVLEHLRRSRRCRDALVLVVSTSDSELERFAKLKVNGYFRKPSDFEEFLKLGDMIKELFSRKA